MSLEIAAASEIPPILPIEENTDEREKLLRQAAGVNETPSENLPAESDDEDTEELTALPKTSKKKLFFAFVLVVFGFILLVLLMSWFFGIGAFAPVKPQAVDRTSKANSGAAKPVTEEEKLKMALNLVAEKNPNANATVNSADNTNPGVTTTENSSVNVPPVKAADLNQPVIVPDPLSKTAQNPPNSETSNSNSLPGNTAASTVSNPPENPGKTEKNQILITPPSQRANNTPTGRSLFFGIERKEIVEGKTVNLPSRETMSKIEPVKFTGHSTPQIPFGTLLPVRLLGAVYTLRASGGLVRMELTRQVSGKNYLFPAGTILVGNLRGSERNRPFISIVGLIDPASGGLIKFTGEVMGNDGASGVVGRTRQMKSAWSRVLGGLRDVGTVAIGALGSRRSGGTVIISDSTNKASGVLSEELSRALGNTKNTNEFVEVPAATTAFVLVTDLPGEVSKTYLSGPDTKSATGLSESELADLFSEGNKERIRAALGRMTPEFRKLAEKYLAAAQE